MANELVQFYRYPQEVALLRFPHLLESYFPQSNSIHNRTLSPLNHPSRHCLFAATFSPDSDLGVKENYTILFSDRSRHLESQVWIFNPLVTQTLLTTSQQAYLTKHIRSLLLFLKATEIPEAPGWPFLPHIMFSCIHQHISTSLHEICAPLENAIPYLTSWNYWNISLKNVLEKVEKRMPLPEGYTVSKVPDEQVDLVIATSSIKRQKATLLLQPNIGLMNEKQELVAWGYIGADGSLATLYVLEEYRGKRLATFVALELLGRLGRGEFRELGYDGRSGWGHSCVKDGNTASEGVMRSVGGEVGWKVDWLRIDSEKFQELE